jgi:hypothetical protein
MSIKQAVYFLRGSKLYRTLSPEERKKLAKHVCLTHKVVTLFSK